MQKLYNVSNLRPFTKDNASYYGKIGGLASGKSKLKRKIKKMYMLRYMTISDLERYKGRKRIYNRELAEIKQLLHDIKIMTNRITKLEDKYESKYKNTSV